MPASGLWVRLLYQVICMRSPDKPGRSNKYWENIKPAHLAGYIDALPAKHELFYFAKLVAEGMMRDMSTESQFRYGRIREATMRYLVESQPQENVVSMDVLYTPFIYLMCKKFPTITSFTFSHIFQQFIRFAGKQEPISPTSADGVASLIQRFVGGIKKV